MYIILKTWKYIWLIRWYFASIYLDIFDSCFIYQYSFWKWSYQGSYYIKMVLLKIISEMKLW